MIKYHEVVFDGRTIRGFLHTNHNSTITLMFHGFTGNKSDHHYMFKQFADEMLEAGSDVYRFDFLGCGDSDGKFSEMTFSSQLKQAQFVLDCFQSYKKMNVFGFSMGGAIAALLAGANPRIKSLFLLSPAGDMRAVLRNLLPMKDGEIYDLNGFSVSQNFVDEIMELDLYRGIENYQGNVSIVLGTNDPLVKQEVIETYRKMYQRDIYVKMVEGAIHTYASIPHTKQVLVALKQFIQGESE